jgi:hypothetical protein
MRQKQKQANKQRKNYVVVLHNQKKWMEAISMPTNDLPRIDLRHVVAYVVIPGE